MAKAYETSDDESLLILEKIMENSYQRKIMRETMDRVFSKMAKVVNIKFPEDELKKLKDEFVILKHSMSILK